MQQLIQSILSYFPNPLPPNSLYLKIIDHYQVSPHRKPSLAALEATNSRKSQALSCAFAKCMKSGVSMSNVPQDRTMHTAPTYRMPYQ